MDGNVVFRYQIQKNKFSIQRSEGLSIDQKTVYVVDVEKDCTGLSMDGYIVFRYRDQNVGLAIDGVSLFISVAKGGAKVRRLSISGDDGEDLDLGNFAPRKITDNTLIIQNFDDKNDSSIEFSYLL